MWMNEYDVEDALRRANPETEPVFTEAVIALANLVSWTNSNSDGWPYWSKPSNAAKALQTAIQAHLDYDRTEYQHPRKGAPLDAATLKKALSPIKAFLTRQGVSHDVLGTYAYRVVSA